MYKFSSDKPETDFIINDQLTKKTNRDIEGFLTIKDVLGIHGPLVICGMEFDAIIDYTIVQTGDGEMSIEEVKVQADVIDIFFNGTSGMQVTPSKGGILVEAFFESLDKIVLNMAKNTSEDSWDYRLGDNF